MTEETKKTATGPPTCYICGAAKVALRRPKNGKAICESCFVMTFEEEIHQTILAWKMYSPGDTVAVAVSGGKDSTVLMHVLDLLNKRHNYGIKLHLLSVDEGICGYRDKSLETVYKNKDKYNLPLKVLSFKDMYGYTVDEIVKMKGLESCCTHCGVLRRQAFDRGAMLIKANKVATGHNADDTAETVLMNVLRGDVNRIEKAAVAITHGGEGMCARTRPLLYCYEKEIVMYSHYRKLLYFSTECGYNPMAYRGNLRGLIKDLERVDSQSVINILHSGSAIVLKQKVKKSKKCVCSRCGFASSQKLCKACTILEMLNSCKPQIELK
ncbi:MAG: ATP-binding protein [Candidatus Pacebacteria bacterium]|nr:ATP-binding protein [Candidatus Paceibacterota bacterium]